VIEPFPSAVAPDARLKTDIGAKVMIAGHAFVRNSAAAGTNSRSIKPVQPRVAVALELALPSELRS
jgi:hypothetical protein